MVPLAQTWSPSGARTSPRPRRAAPRPSGPAGRRPTAEHRHRRRGHRSRSRGCVRRRRRLAEQVGDLRLADPGQAQGAAEQAAAEAPPASSGRACSNHIGRISRGGPGSRTTTRPSGRPTHQPGAVPFGLGSGRALGISQACLRLISGKGRSAPGPQAAQPGLQARVHGRLLAHDEGDRLAGQVIRRRAEAAGRDDQVCPPEGCPERAGDGPEAIGQDVDPGDPDACFGQAAGDLAAVRVARIADGQLGPDGQQLGRAQRAGDAGRWGHGRSVAQRAGPAADDGEPGPSRSDRGRCGAVSFGDPIRPIVPEIRSWTIPSPSRTSPAPARRTTQARRRRTRLAPGRPRRSPPARGVRLPAQIRPARARPPAPSRPTQRRLPARTPPAPRPSVRPARRARPQRGVPSDDRRRDPDRPGAPRPGPGRARLDPRRRQALRQPGRRRGRPGRLRPDPLLGRLHPVPRRVAVRVDRLGRPAGHRARDRWGGPAHRGGPVRALGRARGPVHPVVRLGVLVAVVLGLDLLHKAFSAIGDSLLPTVDPANRPLVVGVLIGAGAGAIWASCWAWSAGAASRPCSAW